MIFFLIQCKYKKKKKQYSLVEVCLFSKLNILWLSENQTTSDDMQNKNLQFILYKYN